MGRTSATPRGGRVQLHQAAARTSHMAGTPPHRARSAELCYPVTATEPEESVVLLEEIPVGHRGRASSPGGGHGPDPPALRERSGNALRRAGQRPRTAATRGEPELRGRPGAAAAAELRWGGELDPHGARSARTAPCWAAAAFVKPLLQAGRGPENVLLCRPYR